MQNQQPIDSADTTKDNNEKEVQIFPRSYHTFLFPFIWGDSNKESPFGINLSNEELERRLSPKSWIPITWEKDEIPEYDKRRESNKEYETRRKNEYGIYQYFTNPARNLAFGDVIAQISKNDYKRTSDLVRCYEFHPNEKPLSKGARYVINKKADKIDYTYNLRINRIRINVYNTGIAILAFELSCFDADNNFNSENIVDDINRINEFGRRINFPYLPNKGERNVLTADSISIEGIEEASFTDNFDVTDKPNLSHVMNPILDIISYKNDYKPTSSSVHYFDDQQNKRYRIIPAIDDRMFVCCLLRDDGLAESLKQFSTETSEYAYLANCLDDTYASEGEEKYKYQGRLRSNTLYKFAFVETSLNCNSKTMERALLQRCIYDRWIDYGTVYASTHHSFMAVIDESVDEKTLIPEALATVIIPFTTIYVEMAILVLAQRASILSLSTAATDIAGKYDSTKTSREIGYITDKISKLQEINARAQNQIILSSVTAQEQGEEIFDMMLREQSIEKNNQDLKDQLSNLYEIALSNFERADNKQAKIIEAFLIILTICGLILAFTETAAAIFENASYLLIIAYGMAFVALIGSVIYIIIKNRKKNYRNIK